MQRKQSKAAIIGLSLFFLTLLLPSLAHSQLADTRSFKDLDASRFVVAFNMAAEMRNMRNRLSILYCTGEEIKVCNYNYGTVNLVTGTIRGGNELSQVLWTCARGCKGEDIFTGVVISLRLLAPERSSEEYTAWVATAGSAQRTKGAARTTLGPVLIAVTDSDLLGTWVALRPIP